MFAILTTDANMDVANSLCFMHDPIASRRFFAFDMYGTLVRARFGNLDDIYEAFYKLFPDADPDDVRREYESFVSGFTKTHGLHVEMTIAQLLEHMDSVFGTSNDSLEAENTMMRATHTFIPVKGAEETLSFFRDHGYKIGVLSNTSYRGSVVKGLLEDVGFDHLIDVVVSSADVGYKKPHHRAYEAVLEALGARPDECFFAGDSKDKDFFGPRRFGMRGAFLIDPSHPSKEDGIVASIADIPSFFRD
jgi:putative hydrolase of the HAD superfamily